MNPEETHEKIIGVLKEKGPSLPINIAKALSISSLFISAFLSELTNQKRIEVSSLKVGGSPLYYMRGQEEKLEDYYKYLHPRESEAFLLLKEHNVLKDSDQDPATRVALRSIKDFSIGFKIDDEIYWKFVSVPQSEVDSIFNGGKNEIKEEDNREVNVEVKEEIRVDLVEKENKVATNEVSSSIISEKVEGVQENQLSEATIVSKPREVVVVKEENNEFQNPLVVKEEKKKGKVKSEFVEGVVGFIERKGLLIVEEKEYKVKEYNCIVGIKSELGLINFLTQAKDKKTITEGDFKKLLSTAQSIPLPAFMLYTGEIGKKAKEYLERYSSVLKARRIKA